MFTDGIAVPATFGTLFKMNIDITYILEIVVTLITMVLTVFLAPYIKSRFDAARLEKIMRWVEIAVQAAEMIYRESGMGAKKKEYVLNFLNEKGFNVDVDSLDNMIESAVLKMKYAISNGQ